MPRHLPLVQSRDDDGPSRPPWQWALIGAVFAVSLWVPFGMLASSLTGTWARALAQTAPLRLFVVVVAPNLVVFVLASSSAGTLIGRFGADVGPRHGVVAGLLAALFGSSMSLLRGGAPIAALFSFAVLAALGAASGALGASMGRRLRLAPRAIPPTPSAPPTPTARPGAPISRK